MKITLLFASIANLLIMPLAMAFPAPSTVLDLLTLQGDESICYVNKIDEKIVQEVKQRLPYGNLYIDNLEKGHYDAALLTSSQGGQDINILTEALKENGRGLIIVSLGNSNEYKVISWMAQTPRWSEKLMEYYPLTIKDYHQAVWENGLTIRFSEIKKGMAIFEDQLAFKNWVLNEMAPAMNMDPSDYEIFAEDYMTLAKEHHLIHIEDQKIFLNYKQLILLFAK